MLSICFTDAFYSPDFYVCLSLIRNVILCLYLLTTLSPELLCILCWRLYFFILKSLWWTQLIVNFVNANTVIIVFSYFVANWITIVTAYNAVCFVTLSKRLFEDIVIFVYLFSILVKYIAIQVTECLCVIFYLF